MPTSKLEMRLERKKRIRRKVKGTTERPRLTVFRSNKQIYAQVIDDVTGQTLVQASSLDKELRDSIKQLRENPPKPAEEAKEEEGGDKKKKGKKAEPVLSVSLQIAGRVGEAIANRCKAKNIENVVFDRNGYMYHGRVKQLAEAARKGGLSF